MFHRCSPEENRRKIGVLSGRRIRGNYLYKVVCQHRICYIVSIIQIILEFIVKTSSLFYWIQFRSMGAKSNPSSHLTHFMKNNIVWIFWLHSTNRRHYLIIISVYLEWIQLEISLFLQNSQKSVFLHWKNRGPPKIGVKSVYRCFIGRGFKIRCIHDLSVFLATL